MACRFGGLTNGRTQPIRVHTAILLTAPSALPVSAGPARAQVFTHLVGDKAGDLNDLLTHGAALSPTKRGMALCCKAGIGFVLSSRFRFRHGLPARSLMTLARGDLIGRNGAENCPGSAYGMRTIPRRVVVVVD